MLGKILLLSFSFFSFNSLSSPAHRSVFNQHWSYIASIKTKSILKTYEKLSHLDIDIAGVDHKEKIIDVLVNDLELNTLELNKFSLTIKETKGVSAAPDKGYKNPSEIERILKDYAIEYAHLLKLEVIGRSVEGRSIFAVKISNKPRIEDLSKPSILFNSMHHAREVMTPEVSLDIIDYLLRNYETDSRVKKWVDNNQIWVIPMLNVDGNFKMWNEDKWWRKNNRGGYGVDLNRNYPASWGKCNGSSSRRSSDTYRGPSPASEPETKAMMNFIKRVRPVFDISYHSYSELVIYPLGCRPQRTKNIDVVEGIGKKLANILKYKAGTAWELLYNADGGDIDWMYDSYQVIPYVVELNSRKQGFHPSYKRWRDRTVIRNRKGWMYLLDQLDKNAVRGVVKKDSQVLTDYIVKVFSIDQKSYLQDYNSQDTGLYHIVLRPGKYKLEFMKKNQKLITKYITIDNKLLKLDVFL